MTGRNGIGLALAGLACLWAAGAEAQSFNTRATAACAYKADTLRDDRRDVKLANDCDVKHSTHDGVEVIHVWIAGGPEYRFVRRSGGWIYTDGRGRDHSVSVDKDGRVLKFYWQDRGHHYSLRVAVD